MSYFETEINDDVCSEELYFYFSATLRIFGKNLDFELINNTIGIQPTHIYIKGEYHKLGVKPIGKPYENDMWMYEVQVHKKNDLDKHIQSLWAIIKPHKEFLLSLKENHIVDVFCGYRSNCDHAGFEVSPRSLEMFIELDIPFGISVIVC